MEKLSADAVGIFVEKVVVVHTGNNEWDLRSCYDAADSGSWGGENVFDVRSKSKDKALNGENYSDW